MLIYTVLIIMQIICIACTNNNDKQEKKIVISTTHNKLNQLNKHHSATFIVLILVGLIILSDISGRHCVPGVESIRDDQIDYTCTCTEGAEQLNLFLMMYFVITRARGAVIYTCSNNNICRKKAIKLKDDNTITKKERKITNSTEINHHLLLVPRGLLCPLVKVGIDVSVIASQSRVKDLIREGKRIHKRNCLFPYCTKENIELISCQSNLITGHILIL